MYAILEADSSIPVPRENACKCMAGFDAFEDLGKERCTTV